MTILENALKLKSLYSLIKNEKSAQELENTLESVLCFDAETLKKSLPEVLPLVATIIHNTKKTTAEMAKRTIEHLCDIVDNVDLKPFLPSLQKCLVDIDYATQCVHDLAATTFVQQVDASSLAVVHPVVYQGLRQRTMAIKRKSLVIIENMSKLVDNPNDAYVFVSELMPIVEKEKDIISDPECRKVAQRAYERLQQLSKAMDAKPEDVKTKLKELNMLEEYDTVITALRLNVDLKTVYPESQLAEAFVVKKVDIYEADDNAETLCDCNFSLAYGAKILLSNTNLYIKRGKIYGLCGPNGSGKSTLMRAIANNQLEGFPDSSELKTIYVEHDIDADDSEIKVKHYITPTDSCTFDTICNLLRSYGFNDERMEEPISSLSGGWKMKLALAKAMSANADILLLDEPTNHLDVRNVQWLVDYLTGLSQVTSIVVSHDSTFLDNTCQYIIHYEGLKLVTYKGNLSEFVKQVPSAASYYSLDETTLDFRFPTPGFLEGVKNKDKALIKLTNVTFGYDPNVKLNVKNASLQCSLSSRVGVQGPNGAGKSTLIKLVTGEVKATSGTLWRHPNVRIAYVAQHAFHHIENHLDKTANQYMQWRFAGNLDKEALDKDEFKLTEEEQEELFKPRMIKMKDENGVSTEVKLVYDKIVGKRKLKGNDEYEFAWKHTTLTTWLDVDTLKAHKFDKVRVLFDQKQAAAAGMVQKNLTQKEIAKHLADVGLEEEFSTHSLMKGLSGGQKVKVVIGAAMWYNPHMIVLDEPTNYLDRDSLSALAKAINAFEGGSIIISHNAPFVKHTCVENWQVEDGVLTITGNKYKSEKIVQKTFEQEEYMDALGNTVKVEQPKKKLSKKEQKARKKLKDAARARGEEVSSDDE